MEEEIKATLKAMGAVYTVQKFTGDNSYPVEHTIRHRSVSAMGPTFEMAFIEFLGKLLKKIA